MGNEALNWDGLTESVGGLWNEQLQQLFWDLYS